MISSANHTITRAFPYKKVRVYFVWSSLDTIRVSNMDGEGGNANPSLRNKEGLLPRPRRTSGGTIARILQLPRYPSYLFIKDSSRLSLSYTKPFNLILQLSWKDFLLLKVHRSVLTPLLYHQIISIG